MTRRSRSYVPRGSRLRWRSFLLFFLVCCAVVFGIQHVLENRQQRQVNTYGVCGLSNLQTHELLGQAQQEQTELLTLSDYLFYGETLNLYHEMYNKNTSDRFAGKMVILRNLCSGLDFVYMMEKQADGQIPLEDLDPGFYQVYIMEDLKEKKVVSQQKLNDVFYTVTRNGTNHKIELIADQNRFDDETDTTPFLDQNYLFLQVSEEAQPQDYVDIMIDPGGMNQDNGYTDRGVHGNGLEAYLENYRLAEKLKEELEKLGLKVELTRQQDEVVNSYGEDGRLDRAYSAHARYYLDLEMKSAINMQLRGTDIVYSSFSSSRMASTVLKSLVENTSLIYAQDSTGSASGTSVGVDGTLYDGQKMIRESGGRILGAATFSEASMENTAFAAENRWGMQTLIIQTIFVSNPQDAAVWQSELDEIASAIAQGIAQALRLSSTQ